MHIIRVYPDSHHALGKELIKIRKQKHLVEHTITFFGFRRNTLNERIDVLNGMVDHAVGMFTECFPQYSEFRVKIVGDGSDGQYYFRVRVPC